MHLQPLSHPGNSPEGASWRAVFDALARADVESSLAGDDLVRLATAAYLVGRDAVAVDAWTRAHQAFLAAKDTPAAVRCAYWLGYALLRKGERARGGGWLARAQRLLEECGEDCVERGYLLLPAGMRAIGEGDVAAAYDAFCRVADIAARFRDADLAALGLHSRGRVLIRLDRIDEGIALLDEAMTAVDAGDVSPLVVGDVYCSVIEGCIEIFDMRRAQEWTAVLAEWCDAHTELVPFRGQCLVRRAEIMRLHGAWPAALDEAERACEWLSRPPAEPATGAAYYQQAELHRLRGELAEAEHAYREAGLHGRSPHPGLAQLRLARGEVGAAAAASRQAVADARDRHVRVRLLPAHVEIMIAAGDAAAARAAADELEQIAGAVGTPFLHALAADAQAAVLLAEGDESGALGPLRRAFAAWQQLDAPYEAARTRVLRGLAYNALGDDTTAAIEFEAARSGFEELGAGPDLARVDELTQKSRKQPGGLTPREREVLRLVASGRTNRAIATELFISEKTVARHLSNIFGKLRISSRAAATAYAYEHGLIRR